MPTGLLRYLKYMKRGSAFFYINPFYKCDLISTQCLILFIDWRWEYMYRDNFHRFSTVGYKVLCLTLTASLTLGLAACGRRGNVQDDQLRLRRSSSTSSEGRSERVIKRSTTDKSQERKTLATTVKPSVVRTNPPSPQTQQQTKPAKTQPPQTEAPVTNPPQTQPPQTQPPQTEAPVTNPPQTEPPQTEAPVTNPPQTDPVVPENPDPPAVDSGDAGISGPVDDNTDNGDVIVIEDSNIDNNEDTEPASGETSFVLNDFVATSLADISTIEFGSAGGSLKMVTNLVKFIKSWPKDLNDILADPAKLQEAAGLAVANMDSNTFEILKDALPHFYTEGEKLLTDTELLKTLARDAAVELPETLPTPATFKQIIEAIALAANVSLELPSANGEPGGEIIGDNGENPDSGADSPVEPEE